MVTRSVRGGKVSRTWSGLVDDANSAVIRRQGTAKCCRVTLPLMGGKIANVFDQSVTVVVSREQKPL